MGFQEAKGKKIPLSVQLSHLPSQRNLRKTYWFVSLSYRLLLGSRAPFEECSCISPGLLGEAEPFLVYLAETKLIHVKYLRLR